MQLRIFRSTYHIEIYALSYTTLFRSAPWRPRAPPAPADGARVRGRSLGWLRKPERVPHVPPGRSIESRSYQRSGQETTENRPGRDRKSTRLNSSHVKISYAVFCLKKK